MTQAFISFSPDDRGFFGNLKRELESYNIDVISFATCIKKEKKSIAKIVDEKLTGPDSFIIVLSKKYLSDTKDLNILINAILLKEDKEEVHFIILVLIEDCEIPEFLSSRKYIDFRSEWTASIEELAKIIKNKNEMRYTKQDKSSSKVKNILSESDLNIIKKHYKKGNLSIFCGSGVSVDAGLPSWQELLNNLLIRLFKKEYKGKFIEESKDLLADIYQTCFNHSPLMIAQYLKNGFGKDFIKNVRDELYSKKIKESELINGIVELCRPLRVSSCLNSIVTFNFDDLIEEKLDENKILNKPIFSEGERWDVDEIPIFHVHGFLPRKENLQKNSKIVFSEDAYHSEFIEPFSWSNLVQLTHLSQNLCLFIGLSLTDPNLRRILDVSRRKKLNREIKHYYFKKRYDKLKIEDEMRKMNREAKNIEIDNFIDFIEKSEEEEAYNLGLNVIWIDDYTEIPMGLRKVAAIEENHELIE